MRYPVYRKLSSRTRTEDFTEALSMEVYDPLWMLGRQWQFGRFTGNDCGSTVTSKIITAKQRVCDLNLGDKYTPFTLDSPLEYEVEKQNHEIDYQVRVESALHFMWMYRLGVYDSLFKDLVAKFPLDPLSSAAENKGLEDLVVDSNERLQKMARFYGPRLFDGYKLYLSKYSPKTDKETFKAKLQQSRSGSRRSICPRGRTPGTAGIRRNWDMR